MTKIRVDQNDPATGPSFTDEQQQFSQPQGNTFQAGRDDGKNAPNLSKIVGRYASIADDSAAPMKYTEQLKNCFARDFGDKFTFVRLTVPKYGVAILSGKNAVIIVFENGSSSEDGMPCSRYDKPAYNELLRTHPEAELIKFIVVAEEDYERVSQMYQYLIRLFNVVNNTEDVNGINAADLSNMQFRYSDNPDDFMTVFDQYSPHAVPLRHDISLVMYIGENKHGNNNNAIDEGYYSNIYQPATPFVAISGYVDFVRKNPSETLFVPFVHISEIIATVPSSSLMPMFLALANRQFIASGAWWNQYARYDGKQNIGNLIPDNSQQNQGKIGNRWFCKNQAELDQFRINYITKPVFVLDVTEGRASINGIEYYATDARNGTISAIYDAFSKFANVSYAINGTADRFSLTLPFYRGTFKYGNQSYDTALIDFLMEYSKTPAKAAELEGLLFKKESLRDRMNELKTVEPTTKMLYRTDVVVLPAHLLVAIAQNLTDLNFNKSFSEFVTFDDLADYGQYSARVNGGAVYGNDYTPFTAFFH